MEIFKFVISVLAFVCGIGQIVGLWRTYLFKRPLSLYEIVWIYIAAIFMLSSFLGTMIDCGSKIFG